MSEFHSFLQTDSRDFHVSEKYHTLLWELELLRNMSSGFIHAGLAEISWYISFLNML